MDDETHIKIADQMTNMCRHCQLYAAKFFIWNAEPEELREILVVAIDALAGVVDDEGYVKEIRSMLSELPHPELRVMGTQISLLLEGPCKTEECQVACDRYRKEK